tara:strand:- start:550 stop:1200 length:651 start_codon:yes stop_codon:yes gene_type:complete
MKLSVFLCAKGLYIKGMTSKENDRLRQNIVQTVLEESAFEPFRLSVILSYLKQKNVSEQQFEALYPDGLPQLAQDISDFFDKEMLGKLPTKKPEDMRIRDAIELGVLTRLEVMMPYKGAVQTLTQYWGKPWTGLKAGKAIWSTVDNIWNWAGDTSTDYNHYTKRSLLSGVLASTYLYWVSEDDPDLQKTQGFLARRIENVMQLGKVIGRFKKKKVS